MHGENFQGYCFRNIELWAPELQGIQDLLVMGKEIVAIGQHLEFPSSWSIQEIDGNGNRLIPGLVDVHAHLAGGGGEGGAHTRVPALGPSHLIRAGVTTAVGVLGTDGTTRTIAELLAVARGIESFGPTTFIYTGSYQVPPVTLTGSVRGDMVHIDRIVAIGEVAISDHRSSQPTFDEIARLAADAHVSGLMTGKAGLIHLHVGDGRRGLELVNRLVQETELPPRTFHPTHCNRSRKIWEEAKELSKTGVHIDVTAFPEDETDAPMAGDAIADWWRSGLEPSRLTMSSDGGGCLPVFDSAGLLLKMGIGSQDALLEAVQRAEKNGVPYEIALQTVTRNPARLFRLRNKGEIRVGGDADIVLLDASGRPEFVICRGKLVMSPEGIVTGPFGV